MVKSRDHFDRTPSNVVLFLNDALGALSMAGLFQQIDTRAFHRLASLSKPFRFGLYVLESRERHALPSSKASFTIDESHL